MSDNNSITLPHFERNDTVIIKEGATDWMKEHGYWLKDMGGNIDNFYGTIEADYTSLPGNDCHYIVDLGFDFGVGVHPQWLIAM